MSRFLNDTPPPHGSFTYIPKGKANIRVNEILDLDGQSVRNAIGMAWTATPLKSPVIAETVFGVLELVNLPSIDDLGTSELPLAGGALAQPLSMTTSQHETIH